MPDGLPHRSCRVFRAYRILSVSAVRRCCFFFCGRNEPFCLISIAAANMKATRFLKKLFCTDGRSPASLTNAPIKAKQKAELIMHSTPLCFGDILLRIFAILNHLFLLRQTAVVRFRAVLFLRPMRKARGGRTCSLS